MVLRLVSDGFEHHGEIPRRFTCDGDDVSPPLKWTAPPEGTRSLALIVDDPDAPDPEEPKATWAHWLLYNLPPDCPGLEEGVPPDALPGKTREGLNGWGRTGYRGPCPSVGRHRYFHRLYALDSVLPDLGRPARKELLAAMEGHILAGAELIGMYQKPG